MELTEVIGSFGKFQKRVLLVNILTQFAISTVVNNYFFVSRSPLFHCGDTTLVGLVDAFNVTSKANDNYTCQLPIGIPSRNYSNSSVLQFQRCGRYSYSTPYRFSIAQEWDLVCSREWLVYAGYFVFFLSNLCAFIPCGIFCDKFGRRKALLCGTCLNLVGCFTKTISNSFFMFWGSTFFAGFGYVLVNVTSVLYFMEFVGPKARFLSNVASIAHGLGIVFMSGCSWLIVDWKYFTAVTTIPINLILLVLQIRYIPESLRWLQSVCKYQKAWFCLEAITKVNNIEIGEPEDTMVKLTFKIDEDRKWNLKPAFCSLTKNPKIRMLVLTLMLIGFTRSFIVFGFLMIAARSKGSFHLNMTMFGLLSVVEALIGVLTVKFVRRRRATLINSLLTTTCFVALAILNGSVSSVSSNKSWFKWLQLTLGAIAYATHSASGAVFRFYLNEVFPTNARATMIGSVKTVETFGYMLSPLVHLLGNYTGSFAVATIYAVLAIVPAILTFTLPETKDVNLPDTFSETKRIAINDCSRTVQEWDDNEYQLNSMLL